MGIYCFPGIAPVPLCGGRVYGNAVSREFEWARRFLDHKINLAQPHALHCCSRKRNRSFAQAGFPRTRNYVPLLQPCRTAETSTWNT
jgi:hypothetical protein